MLLDFTHFVILRPNFCRKNGFFPKNQPESEKYVSPYRNYLVLSPHIHYFCSYNSICHHNCSRGMRKNPYFFLSNLGWWQIELYEQK